ncbi:hypothetical protein RHMOL_Rhmol01G0225800 [Rhododendron molle]|uniref:Uncharacterized protein n=1 Tax=Rhododendron molle TaxID=49168 RepID=A0ACC0Q5N6_RHOML|nr:hypothetical protein RHMOL_Rhmol01G0225800 [Rhododendron molle]
MRYLRNICLCSELLRAAASFWDPEVHMLRFGEQELCPTVEEFHAYLGGFGSARYLVSNGCLNTMRLIEMFSPSSDLMDMAHKSRRMMTLCKCLIAAYLLVPSIGHASSSLVSITVQIEAQKDVVPMIWLCDKVNVLTIPSDNWAYEARLLSRRCFEFVDPRISEWVSFFKRLGAETIS